MSDEQRFERRARAWLERGPTGAPDRVIEAALLEIDQTSQERDLRVPWRLPTMFTGRILAAAAVAVLSVAVAALVIFKPSPSGSVAEPTATPSVAPTTAAIPRPIPNGTYYSAEIPVTDIMTRLAADTQLTAEQRATVINDILTIADATTLRVKLTIRDDTFTPAYGTDGSIAPGDPWRLYILDATTIAVRVPLEGSGIQAWGVTRDGDGFTLRALSPAPEPVETFVRSVLFETTPFAPLP
jgi:hypothetical protein